MCPRLCIPTKALRRHGAGVDFRRSPGIVWLDCGTYFEHKSGWTVLIVSLVNFRLGPGIADLQFEQLKKRHMQRSPSFYCANEDSFWSARMDDDWLWQVGRDEQAGPLVATCKREKEKEKDRESTLVEPCPWTRLLGPCALNLHAVRCSSG